MKIPFIAVATALTAFNAAGAFAASSRLPATGGVTQIEGAAGGGLVPWAVIAGVGSRDEIGGSTWCTQVEPSDFRLTGCGIGVGVLDRAEVSYARQRFGLGTTVPGESIDQDIVGLKVRLFGDAVFDQDTWLPQIAVGIQYKKNRDFAIPELIGARDDNGIDYYLAATATTTTRGNPS
jgi:hypothetical protein